MAQGTTIPLAEEVHFEDSQRKLAGGLSHGLRASHPNNRRLCKPVLGSYEGFSGLVSDLS